MKSAFKNSSTFVQILMLLVVIFIGNMAGGLILGICLVIQVFPQTHDISKILEIANTSSDLIREQLFINHLFTMLFPALLAAYLFCDNYKDYLKLETPFNFKTLFWTVLSMLVALPALNFVTSINQQITLPPSLKAFEDFIRTMEEQATELISLILNSDKIGILILNILIIAVMAAIGEEFLFRGILQNIFAKAINNQHIVIWTVAIIFSAIHLQFLGFLPRMLLGAYLGYLLFYTKSLWIPVIAHFTNNFTAVTVSWYYRNDEMATDAFNSYGTGETWWAAVASLAIFLFCIRQIKKSYFANENNYKKIL
ncbi:MAG: CPBP family intramembrane metalloprotease [Dysgonamonadaceae bacterium]|jgi:membrane protease YdiL (CAAX protease family)|nr:CPBP family intramembrane metalloprotease [Dysgonamonadaceae bacterium]